MISKTQLKCANPKHWNKKDISTVEGIEIRIHLSDRKICFYLCSTKCAHELLEVTTQI